MTAPNSPLVTCQQHPGQHGMDVDCVTPYASVQIRAADLPNRSVVADNRTAFIKNNPTLTAAWSGTNGGYFANFYIDERLAAGAVVLRDGAGEEPRRA